MFYIHVLCLSLNSTEQDNIVAILQWGKWPSGQLSWPLSYASGVCSNHVLTAYKRLILTLFCIFLQAHVDIKCTT